MRYRFVIIWATAAMLAGCKSVDGIYYPGCPAHAGDKVLLDGGRATWDRFTDEVRIGADGKPIDPFPDYPREGTYRIEGETLELALAGETGTRRLHILADGDRVVLLDEKQHAKWQETGRYDVCALTRETSGSD